MVRLLLSVVILSWGAVAWSGDGPSKPEARPTAEAVKANPNDAALLNRYFGLTFGRVAAALDDDPKAAEATLREIKQTVEAIKPTDEQAKRWVQQAQLAITHFEQQLELGRTPLEEVVKRLVANPDDTKAVELFLAKVQRQVGANARSKPDQAEADLKAAKATLAKARDAAKDEGAKRSYERATRTFDFLQRDIDSAKKLLALIGKDAAPLAVEAWVNGTPLTDADLKGKVVLLDFWAVWCGPCIATFPHLREWQEKYADKGLVIIGLTNYYGLVWDDTAKRAVQPAPKPQPKDPAAKEGTPPAEKPAPAPAKATPAEEQEMLKQFAAHHQLKHRLAIQKDRSLAEYYAVGGIPHVVVIDRHGKVAIIRVGSGEENAKAVEEKIVAALGDVK